MKLEKNYCLDILTCAPSTITRLIANDWCGDMQYVNLCHYLTFICHCVVARGNYANNCLAGVANMPHLKFWRNRPATCFRADLLGK